MPRNEPYEFQKDQDIITTLNQNRVSLEKWFNRSIRDLKQVIYISVSGNTFRAFQHMPQQPSVVFRRWAEAEFNNLQNLVSVLHEESQSKYDEWTKALVSKLSRTGRKQWGDQYLMERPVNLQIL